MKNKPLHIVLMLLLALLMSCSSDEKIEPTILVDTPTTDLILDSKQNAVLKIKFSSTYDWQAKSDAAWIVISPNKGTAGEHEINVLAKEDNRTGDVRSATITITSGKDFQTADSQPSEYVGAELGTDRL